MLIIDRSVITDGGAALLNSGDPINITSVKTGSGTYTSSEDIKSRTALKSTQYSYTPSSVTVDGATRSIDALLSNYDPVTEQAIVTSDYTLTEVGLFATVNGADVLFAIGVSYDGSEVPAFTGQNKSEIIVNWDMAVSGTDAITITATGALALAADLNAHVNSEAYSASGVHGLRVVLDDTDLVLQAYVNGDWEEVSGGGLKIGTITLSSDAVTVDDVTSTATVTFTTNSDGTPSVSSSDDNVAAASLSGTTVTITGVAKGSATVTVSIPATAKYTAVSATISVTADVVDFLTDWLTAGGLNPASYADLDAVLADESAVRKLFTIHDAVDVIVDEVSTIESTDLTKIFNDNYVAKWVNLRDYALDTLYANSTIAGYMDTADKYFYGEWVITDSTTTPVTWGPKGNVPVMTSNTAPYGAASSSTNSSDYWYAWQAFRKVTIGDKSTGWGTSTTGTASAGQYVRYQFVSPIVVTKMSAEWIFSQQANVTYIVQASNDGSTWTNLTSNITVTSRTTDSKQSIKLENSTAYLYYQVKIVSVSGGSDRVYIGALQFYGREMKASVPVMTSNTAPYGTVAYSSTYYQGGQEGWRAFNNNLQDWFAPNRLTLSSDYYLRYNSVIPIKPKKIKIITYNYVSDSISRQYTFYLEGSKDGGLTWTQITDKVTTIFNTIEYKEYELDVTENDQFLQFRVKLDASQSDNYAGNDAYAFRIALLQFFGYDYSEYDWDQTNPRKYIYDHGVEPSGTITGGTKGGHAITLSAVGTATLTIDTTSYTAMGGKAGMRASGTNALKCGSATSNFSATNMPYGNGIDITSVNGSNAVGIAQTSAGTFDAEEVWIA